MKRCARSAHNRPIRTVRSKDVSCEEAARETAAAARRRAIFCWADSFRGFAEALSKDIWLPRGPCCEGDGFGFGEKLVLLLAYGPVAVKRVASVGDRAIAQDWEMLSSRWYFQVADILHRDDLDVVALQCSRAST